MMAKISIKDYSTRIRKEKVYINDDEYIEVRGLNTNDLIELFAERTELMRFIFEGVDFETASNEELANIMIKRGLDIAILVFAIAADEPENYMEFRHLSTDIILQAMRKIIDLTLPKTAKELHDEIKKIQAIIKNFTTMMKS
jgi:hypothetical protein